MSAVTNPAFNPSGKPEVDAIKEKGAELGELIQALPGGRRRSIALTELEGALMWAVKAAVVGDAE